MRLSTGRVWAALAAIISSGGMSAQTLGIKDLSGKYFFRHLSLATDASGNLTDPRSLIGIITFDGIGRYSFSGQQILGSNGAISQTGSGAYSVDPAGVVSMDSPLRTGSKVNARFGPEALLG